VSLVPDGVDGERFRPLDSATVSALRAELGVDGLLVVGVMGTLTFSERLRWGYGVELLQVLAALPTLPVAGLVVGDGRAQHSRVNGCRTGRSRPRAFGHIGRGFPRYINVMDVCLSTQTNDAIGRGRTTAKLPLYLACGRFVLASRVGEAATVLPDDMLVDYAEGFDTTYPRRLADRIARLVADRQLLAGAAVSRRIAQSRYDYRVLVPQVARVFGRCCPTLGNGTGR
jgi:glycosyltransferase involved in cell wall biosynthesis